MNNMNQMNINNNNIRSQNPNVNISQSPGNFNMQNSQMNKSNNVGGSINNMNNQPSGLPTQSIVVNPGNVVMNNNNQMNMSNFNQGNYNMTPGGSGIQSKNGINENSVNFNLIDRSLNYPCNESHNPYMNDFNKNSGFNRMDGSQQSMGQKIYTNSINNQITPGGFNDINAPSVLESQNFEVNVKQNSYAAGELGFPQPKSNIINPYGKDNDDVSNLFPKSNKANLDDFPRSKGDN
jgi:hypothetical protein